MTQIIEVNALTNESIVRDRTADEEAQYQADMRQFSEMKQAQEEAKIEAEAKKATAEAKLVALGLTADDLKALGL